MGHEDTVLSQLIAFAMLVLAVYHFCKGYSKGSKIDLDNIEIFRVQPIQQPQEFKATVKAKVKPAYSDFQLECLAALEAIGYKTKKERVFILHSVFNEHNPSTVQDFIAKVYK